MSDLSPEANGSFVACTLLEPPYIPGLGALANSLVRVGYRGSFFAGCRGISQPPWGLAWAARPGGGWRVEVVRDFVLELIPWDPPRHFTYEKARWMGTVLDDLAPGSAGVAYFDPDVVVRASWIFLEEWMAGGVALVQDLNWDMGEHHPIRLHWAGAARRAGREAITPRSSYVNAGFLGLARSRRGFLDTWNAAIEVALEETRADKHWYLHGRPNPWAWPDQDALNLALMLTRETISEIGRSGMDFEPGGYLMSHAAGIPKPWERRFLRDALLMGQPPRRSEREFWDSVDGPIQVYPQGRVRARRLTLLAGAAVGRMLKRS